MSDDKKPAAPGDDSPSPVPAFRMAFALVGLLVFGASSLVGASMLFGGGYTATVHCDRGKGTAGECQVSLPRVSVMQALDRKLRLESAREASDRRSSVSQVLWLISSPPNAPESRDFICAVPQDAESTARLDALAADGNRFLQGDDRKVLDLRCEGRTATLADALLLTGLSLLIAVASAITLVRGVRQLRAQARPGA